MNATITERQVKTYFSLLGSRPNVAPPERMHFFLICVPLGPVRSIAMSGTAIGLPAPQRHETHGTYLTSPILSKVPYIPCELDKLLLDK